MRKTALLLVGPLLLAGCLDGGYSGPRHSQEVTAKTWDAKILQGRGPILVDFHATWCGPCRRMEPTIESIARDFPVYKLNVDRDRSVATRYGVKGYPTFLIFHNGRVARRLVGMQSERTLRDLLKSYQRFAVSS